MTVAVVIPISNRAELLPDERISLNHAEHYLGKYDKYIVAPKSLKVNFPGFEVRRFGDMYFGSAVANTRLMLSAKFYESFSDYDYILIYQLDALVFSDQLVEWCNSGFDYIGSPWLKVPDSPWVDVPRVGNGGFSLRKIRVSFDDLIYSDRHAVKIKSYWAAYCEGKPEITRYLGLHKKYSKRAAHNGSRRRCSGGICRRRKENEDYFWSDEATKYYRNSKFLCRSQSSIFVQKIAQRC